MLAMRRSGRKKRGKGFALLSGATTKAKEHLVVYCPGLRAEGDSFDAKLRHTLLVNLPKGLLSTINKAGLALRKFDCVCMIVSFFLFLTTVLICIYCLYF